MLTILCSCSKDEKGKPAKPHVYPIHYNTHMAKTITGKSDRWGDFKFIINNGKDNLLQRSYRVNNDMDSLGAISVDRSKTYSINKYQISESIRNISPDSIVRLDAALLAKYGEGNYSLNDSIPMKMSVLKESAIHYTTDNRTYKQVEKFYTPKPDMGGSTDKEFDNTYYLRKTVTHYYEYNNDGYIIVDRIFEDEHYDITDDKMYNRKVFKYEVNYDKERILSFAKYELLAGDNYQEIERYDYIYSNGKIASIKGNKSYNKNFEYTNDNLVINDNGVTHNYKLTSFGYPSRIEDGEGGFMEVEYVQGHGEMDKFISLPDKLYGNPYIR